MPVVGRYEKLVPLFGIDLTVAPSTSFEVFERGYFVRRYGNETLFPHEKGSPPYVMPKGLISRVMEYADIAFFRTNERRMVHNPELESRVFVIEFSPLTRTEVFYLARQVADISKHLKPQVQ